MSQIKLLLDIISDIRSLTDSLEAYANALSASEKIDLNDFEVICTPNDADIPVSQETIRSEDVRSKLAKKSREGYQNEVKALIAKYGGSKFSELSPDVYPELLKELEAM